MDKTTVVNLYKEDYDVYIGMAGKGKDGYFGNPFTLVQADDRGFVLARYKEYFYERIGRDAEFKRRVEELKGLRLGCFCFPKKCHGDVIAEYLNNLK